MPQIIGESTIILDMLNKLGATGGKSPCFNPLVIEISKGKIHVEKASLDHTAFVDGVIQIKTSGKGKIILEVDNVIPKIKKSFKKDIITLDYSSDTGQLIISNDKKRAKTSPPSLGSTSQRPNPFKVNDDNVPMISGTPSKPKPAITHVIIQANELKQLLPEAKDVGVDYFRFVFDEEGSKAWVGEEGGTKDTFDTDLDCVVEGAHADVIYSASFEDIIKVLEGEVELFIAPDSNITPVWIRQPLANGTINYIIAGRLEVSN